MSDNLYFHHVKKLEFGKTRAYDDYSVQHLSIVKQDGSAVDIAVFMED